MAGPNQNWFEKTLRQKTLQVLSIFLVLLLLAPYLCLNQCIYDPHQTVWLQTTAISITSMDLGKDVLAAGGYVTDVASHKKSYLAIYKFDGTVKKEIKLFLNQPNTLSYGITSLKFSSDSQQIALIIFEEIQGQTIIIKGNEDSITFKGVVFATGGIFARGNPTFYGSDIFASVILAGASSKYLYIDQEFSAYSFLPANYQIFGSKDITMIGGQLPTGVIGGYLKCTLVSNGISASIPSVVLFDPLCIINKISSPSKNCVSNQIRLNLNGMNDGCPTPYGSMVWLVSESSFNTFFVFVPLAGFINLEINPTSISKKVWQVSQSIDAFRSFSNDVDCYDIVTFSETQAYAIVHSQPGSSQSKLLLLLIDVESSTQSRNVLGATFPGFIPSLGSLFIYDFTTNPLKIAAFYSGTFFPAEQNIFKTTANSSFSTATNRTFFMSMSRKRNCFFESDQVDELSYEGTQVFDKVSVSYISDIEKINTNYSINGFGGLNLTMYPFIEPDPFDLFEEICFCANPSLFEDIFSPLSSNLSYSFYPYTTQQINTAQCNQPNFWQKCKTDSIECGTSSNSIVSYALFKTIPSFLQYSPTSFITSPNLDWTNASLSDVGTYKIQVICSQSTGITQGFDISLNLQCNFGTVTNNCTSSTLSIRNKLQPNANASHP